MNLFDKRPLSLILCIMLGGFCLFAQSDISSKLVLICLSAASAIAILLIRDLFKSRKRIIVISLFAFSASVLMSLFFFTGFYPTAYYGADVTLIGTVEDADHTGSYESTLTLSTESIDGKAESYRITISGSKDALSGINRSDRISLLVRLETLDSNSSDGYSERNYYAAKGISAKATALEKADIISHESRPTADFIAALRQNINNTFKQTTNYSTGGFLAALITGDRASLDSNTRLNFSRIGISHILALSGMHLAILSAALFKLLRLLRVGKKPAHIILVIFTIGYMTLTGFSSSVTRAGLMLIISSLLFLTGHIRDSVTSLCVAVSIILLIEPYAVYDISLWLSAFATLGVIFYSEIRSKPHSQSKAVRALTGLRDALLMSVFAITASFGIVLLSFGSFSVISLFTTIIFSPLIELLIYLGLITAVLGAAITPLGAITVFFADGIKELAQVFARPGWVLASLDAPAIRILSVILIVAYFICMIFVSVRHRRITCALVLILFILVSVLGLVSTVIPRLEEDIVYSPSSACDSFLVTSEGQTALILSGGSSYSHYSDRLLLSNRNITQLDHLILPSYSHATYTLTEAFIKYVSISTIHLPAPMNDTEMQIAERLASTLSLYGTNLRFYFEEESIDIGNIRYILISHNLYTSDENALNQNIFSLLYNGNYYTYFSRGSFSAQSVEALALISNSHTLILGANGNRSTVIDTISEGCDSLILGYEYKIKQYAAEYYDKAGIGIHSFTDAESILGK